MNRTLTAAVALAAGLGMAVVAQAQGTSSTYPSTPNPGVQTMPASPSTTSPSSTQATQPSSQMPQANATQPSGAPVAMGRQTIQQAQQELKAQGLYNGPIDGIEGPEMKTAVSQFQRQHGLPATAALDQQTMGQLMSASGATQSPSTGMATTPTTGATSPRPASPATTSTTPQKSY